MSVKTTHPDYDAMKPVWQECHDAAKGERAIHEKKETYLPLLDEESKDAYSRRLKMTPFFGATGRTVDGMLGMLYRKPPLKVLPKIVEDGADNIDLAGTSLYKLGADLAEEYIEVFRAGLLVDFPNAGEGLTGADAQRLNLRPKIVMYDALSIINWRHATINNRKMLSLVVLTEEEDLEGEDEFEIKKETRYRVLDLLDGGYRQRLFRVNDKGEDEQMGGDIFPRMAGKPLTEIPFFMSDIREPYLADLARMNLHHYKQSSSYERGCFFSGLPTMFVYGHTVDPGVPGDTIYIGGSIANSLSNPSARAEYVEVNSNFEALRNNLNDKVNMMAVLGARMLESQKAGVEAAETIARRQNGEESILSAIAQEVSALLEKALTVYAEWSGASGEIVYQLNRDIFPASLTGAEALQYAQLMQSGSVSQHTLHELLVKGEITNKTFEDEQALISEQRIIL